MRLSLSSRLGASGLAVLLAACGGGGGGPVPLSVATFRGLYVQVSPSGGTGDFHVTTGKSTGDGAGTMTEGVKSNDMGAISFGSDEFPYTVAADGTMAIPFGAVDLLRGGVSSDGESALLGLVVPALAGSGFMALLRRDGGYDATTVAGSYHSVLYATDIGSGNTFSATGPAMLDAGDGFASGLTRNTMGLVTGSSYTFAYDVFLDGTARVTETVSGAVLDGAFVRGGTVGIFGGAIAPAGAMPAMHVLVRTSSAASPATFAGAYWFVALSRDAVTGEFLSLSGSAEMDGVSTLTWTATANLEGTISPGLLETGAYTVAADGALTIDTSYGTLSGGVSEDGRFAALGGATSPGTAPAIWLFARK